MKTTSFLTILYLFNLFSVINYAQGEAAVPFLLINPSPSLSAMGATGTALPTEDPFGFHLGGRLAVQHAQPVLVQRFEPILAFGN